MISARRLAFFAAVTSSAACNLLVGNHDRYEERADGDVPDRPGDAAAEALDDEPPAPDGPTTVDVFVPGDAQIEIPVDVGGAWKSPNGAAFTTVDGGKRITAYDADAPHPVIVPAAQPTIPSDDYTVHAVVRGPASLGEFGILARTQDDDSAIVFGSSYGAQPKAFVANLASSDWSPALGVIDTNEYSYVGSARYRFKLKVSGSTVSAKFWRDGDAEPTGAILWGQPAYQMGRGVGFYTYGVVDAVLESMSITIP